MKSFCLIYDQVSFPFYQKFPFSNPLYNYLQILQLDSQHHVMNLIYSDFFILFMILINKDLQRKQYPSLLI